MTVNELSKEDQKNLESFSTNLLENSHSLDEETIKIINKNFWDLIERG